MLGHLLNCGVVIMGDAEVKKTVGNTEGVGEGDVDVKAFSVGIPLSSATSTTVKSLSIEKKSMTG